MKIVVNISALTPPLTGIGRYTCNILQELFEHPEVIELKGISPEGLLDKDEVKKKVGMLLTSRPSKSGIRGRVLGKLPGLSQLNRVLVFLQAIRYRRQLQYWSYWEPGFALLPLDCPSVVTFYDLSHIRHPDHHPRHRVKLLDLAIPHALAHARRVLTISEFTCSEIAALLSPTQPIDIAYPGVDSSFFKVTEDNIEECREKLRLPKHFILSVGTLEPRKNLPGLISAFKGLPESIRLKYPLVIAGAKGWHDHSINTAIRELVSQGEARMLGYVDQQDIPSLYAAATITAYMSHYEGFGMPVAESMAAGTPVLTSSVSSMPEVAAGNAITANPNDIGDITTKMALLLSDSELRSRIGYAGQEHARQFSWKKAANTLVYSLQQARLRAQR